MKRERRVNPVAKGIADLGDGVSSGKIMSRGLVFIGVSI
jgi:hypothetical protein